MTKRAQKAAIGTVASFDCVDRSYVVAELYEDHKGELVVGIGRWCECAERGRHKIEGVERDEHRRAMRASTKSPA